MNPVYTILARVIDNLTCGNLDYKDHKRGYSSRATAAAALLEAGAVRETSVPGFYRVTSEEHGRRVLYRVHALAPDHSCECEDFHRHPALLCKHILAAVFHMAIGEVLAEEPEKGRAPVVVPELAADIALAFGPLG